MGDDGVWVHNQCEGRVAKKATSKTARNQTLKNLGLEKINLRGKSFNSGRKALEKAGFKYTGKTRTGRRSFVNDKGVKVHYDSGKALAYGQKNHWHIQSRGGQKYGMDGRPVSSSSNKGHIPGG